MHDRCTGLCDRLRVRTAVSLSIYLTLLPLPFALTRTVLLNDSEHHASSLLTCLYRTWLLISSAKLSAQRRLITRLQMERDMERMDKRWILKEWAITFEGHDEAKRK